MKINLKNRKTRQQPVKKDRKREKESEKMKKQQVAEKKKRFPELMLELRVDFMSMNNIN